MLIVKGKVLEGSEFFLQSQSSNGAIMLSATALAQADLFFLSRNLTLREQWSIIYMGQYDPNMYYRTWTQDHYDSIFDSQYIIAR